ncbi:MAG: hypothetical protein CMG55_07010 [Candidatus Marinimicrobia bacterium]|nr:hypothetical protein [Candidatus Neomarinimicrobiota bacterium]
MYYFKKLVIIVIGVTILLGGELSFRGNSKEQIVAQKIPLSFVNMVMSEYDILASQINPQRGSYLIIAPDGVTPYLDEFISFKKSQGFDTYVRSISEAGGSAAEIKNTIEDILSMDAMLEYVLLIGDVDGFAEFPSFYYGPENDVTDQQYTHILGEDVIPDVFIGRLSIDSLSDLAVIMSKTIQYVRDPLAFNQNWLDRGLIVAGNYANTYPIPITPKWTSYWLRDELLEYGFNEIDTVFYPPIQQGAPYIKSIIDEGVGIVNYRGWGDANGWHYPEFHVDDVNNLNNGWLTPVFFSYVCNSNDFANNVDPCLAEAVIRGGTPTVPKGGVAFIGPSDLHTSTKYNNVINAYMYDAMLNHGVVELGPAMQAGQSGLVKEFPAQNGPGEAQEFYANVYNILGDPSLQVYLDTPREFIFNIQPLYNSEGFLEIMVSSSDNQSVDRTVISVMSDGDLLAKGITDHNGRFLTTLNVDGLASLDIYANKGGFIQGHSVVAIENNNSTIIIDDINYSTENGNVKPVLSEVISMTISLKNTTDTPTEPIQSELSFIGSVEPNLFSLDIPSISGNSSVLLPTVNFICFSTDVGGSVVARLQNPDGSILFNFAIEVEKPVFGIDFVNSGLPGSELSPNLVVTNYTDGAYEGVGVQLSALSEGATVNLNGASDLLSNFPPFISTNHETNYNVFLDNIAYGSDVTFRVEFIKNENSFFIQNVPLHIEPPTANYPLAPDDYGYWAYDNTDIGFDATPVFDWVELDPNYGGSNGVHYQLDDDDHVDLEMPFPFQYHGITYENITINSNGWASFVPCDIDYFWNMSIPMYMGPKALLAPFSDDLETIDTDGDGNIDKWINVYSWYDQSNGRFVIEWSRALNGYDEMTEETFEIIFHDQSSIPTETGDGVIDFQYLHIDDVDVTKNYSTVGIEAPDKDYGLQYVFNNVYSPGAAPLEDGRVIRFTTQSPDNYVGPLGIDERITSEQFRLGLPYPNPFNPTTSFDLMVENTADVTITIIDILGRQVANIYQGVLVNGHYNFSWNGKNNLGMTLGSGTYFTVVKVDKKIGIQKILMLK